MADRDDQTPVGVFHPAYLILVAGVSCTFLSGDLVNLYVGFEDHARRELRPAHHRRHRDPDPGRVDVRDHLVVLLGALPRRHRHDVLGRRDRSDFAQLAGRLQEVLVGCAPAGGHAADGLRRSRRRCSPLAAWLLDSYPTAPAPVTAVFAGPLTGLSACTRCCAPRPCSSPATAFGDLLMLAALASMVIGILGAVAQTATWKRVLSFTLISHIGYMVFGIALAGRGSIAGAIVCVPTTSRCRPPSSSSPDSSSGATAPRNSPASAASAKTAPLLAVLFFVPAMNLAGIPPFSGLSASSA
ncbi:hypothetical protein LV779_27440 [Streptomyces thinghirensis]|nr:hypothetical protein [Streptomyces thinghirensis]